MALRETTEAYTPQTPGNSASHACSPTRSALKATVASFVATRAVVFLAAALGASNLVESHPELKKGAFTEAALRWDAGWYINIVRGGYSIPPSPQLSNLAFPPLLPLCTRAVGEVFYDLGINVGYPGYGTWALAGLVVTNLAFFAGLYILWHLVASEHPEGVARLTLWLVAAFPLGVFWSAIYTQSLTLLLSAGCVLAARTGRWPLSGTLGALAVLTRWSGIILVGVLLVEWLDKRGTLIHRLRVPRQLEKSATSSGEGTRRPAVRLAHLAWVGLLPAALGAHLLYLQIAFGSPWAAFSILNERWRHTLSFFPYTYLEGVSLLYQGLVRTGPQSRYLLEHGMGNSLYMWFDLGFPLIFAALGVVGWRKGWMRPGDVCWLALGIIFPLSSGTTDSLARYLMPLWPAFVVGARLMLHSRRRSRLYLAASTALMALGAFLYNSGHWIG